MRQITARRLAQVTLIGSCAAFILGCGSDDNDRAPVIGAPTGPNPVVVTEGGAGNVDGSIGGQANGANDGFAGNPAISGGFGVGAGGNGVGNGSAGSGTFGVGNGLAGSAPFGSGGGLGFGTGGSF